jgi:hypothetical protein
MVTQLFLRSGLTASANQSPSVVHAPTGFLGAWNKLTTANAGASALYLSNNAGSSQLSKTSINFGSVASGGACQFSIGTIQYASNPLTAQTISSGSWTVAFAVENSSCAMVSLYLVNGSTGVIRSTIFALGSIGATSRASGSELTAFSASVSGSSVVATSGDYLVLETGGGWANVSSTTNVTIFDSGTTAISSDNVSVSTAKSSLTAPGTITFQGSGPPPHDDMRGGFGYTTGGFVNACKRFEHRIKREWTKRGRIFVPDYKLVA